MKKHKESMPLDEMVMACRHNIYGEKPLEGCDRKYEIFYDETNNIRKLHITNNRFNATPKSFVLGGICFSSSSQKLDTTEVRKLLLIQDNAPEIKIHHIGKGTFTKFLNSQKLTTFLNLLLKKQIYIHFAVLDTLYWSLVDIVDSVCFDLPVFNDYALHIKNTIYNACASNPDELAILLNKYNYPNVKRECANRFMLEFGSFIKNNTSQTEDITHSLLQLGASLPHLPFIENNKDLDSILIESFSPFFLRPLYTFPLSAHTFDEEGEIQQELDKFTYSYKGNKIDYQFSNSQDSFEIQLSDVLCGLIGKYYDFLSENSSQELHSIKKGLNERQLLNKRLLTELIMKADQESNGFLHFALPMQTREKDRQFLQT